MAELFNVKLDEEDRALLDACAAKDKLTRSDVVRRAVRAYAQQIGVPEQRPRARGAKPQKRSK